MFVLLGPFLNENLAESYENTNGGEQKAWSQSGEIATLKCTELHPRILQLSALAGVKSLSAKLCN